MHGSPLLSPFTCGAHCDPCPGINTTKETSSFPCLPTTIHRSLSRMSSLGASIPPELFEHILVYVGDEDRLWNGKDPMARREEMKHLSACALTCVYWAQLTRWRMFYRLVLRSAKDINDLRSLLQIYYKLGDIPWFHNVSGLVASGADNLDCVFFHVLGPVPPAFMAGNTRRSTSM
ncbi:hypothetical protein BDY19DRAFT_541316 [Irpex rosettiformis]|uniref:Uncharacterized protein n=1 Tax=Irpex rosettiformis TaxID=378272 RepID=A0ACB8TR49_9APHY|nr:hypothetical protein BDY19DRAFT_541316 [Irpex rosettiformis]